MKIFTRLTQIIMLVVLIMMVWNLNAMAGKPSGDIPITNYLADYDAGNVPYYYRLVMRFDTEPESRLVCEYYDGFSFGNFVRKFPRLQGTVTDILIGDLFTDRVDKVWQPMESLYPPDKTPIPQWDAGIPADKAEDKVNELKLPEGRRP